MSCCHISCLARYVFQCKTYDLVWLHSYYLSMWCIIISDKNDKMLEQLQQGNLSKFLHFYTKLQVQCHQNIWPHIFCTISQQRKLQDKISNLEFNRHPKQNMKCQPNNLMTLFNVTFSVTSFVSSADIYRFGNTLQLVNIS